MSTLAFFIWQHNEGGVVNRIYLSTRFARAVSNPSPNWGPIKIFWNFETWLSALET